LYEKEKKIEKEKEKKSARSLLTDEQSLRRKEKKNERTNALQRKMMMTY